MAVGLLVVAGGVALQRELARRPTASPANAAQASAPLSGARYCPHGGGEGWRVWVVVANPSDASSEVRVMARLGSSLPQVTPAIIEPRTYRYFEVPAGQMAAATTIEFFGEPVAAGMVATRPDGGLAAEPCAGNPDVRWHVPEASTLRGEESYLVVHNPFAGEAVADVALLTGGQMLRPGRLQGVVLAPGEVRALPIHAFALGEEALTATVTAPLGRVVVAGIGVSRGGVRSILGVHAPARRWVLPGGGDPAGGTVVIASPGPRAPFHVTATGEQGEQAVLDFESVDAQTARAFDIVAPGAGVVVASQGKTPLIAGRRLLAEAAPPPPPKGTGGPGKPAQRGPGPKGKGSPPKEKEPPPPPPPGDLAGTRGSARSLPRSVALPPVGPQGAPAILVLHNAGAEERSATVTFLGTAGPPPPPADVVLLPGTTTVIPVPAGPPAAALVETQQGGLVAAQISTTPTSYAVSSAVPMPFG
ncbi:MAG TPA: DUF5719 family protein [Actinomycetota bacterium]|nr:DUF5719 family protein [Actinomycetota bacterium]